MADEDFMSDINDLVNGAVENDAITANPAVDNKTMDDVAGALDESFKSVTTDVAKPPAEKKTEKGEPAKGDEQTKAAIDDKTKAAPSADDKAAKTDDKAVADDPANKNSSVLDTFLQQDDKNNLVLSDGTVIALAGKSRAFFQKLKEEGRNHRLKAMELANSNYQIGAKFKELFESYNKLQNSGQNQLAEMTGYTEQELPEAIALLKEYKTNPSKAIKRLLTQARMRGIDLSEIGINGGVDPSLVREAIEAATRAAKPAQDNSPAMSTEQATQEAENFLTRHPQAAAHVEAIANAKRRFPERSLDELWSLYQIHMVKTQEQEADAQLTKVVTPQQKQQPPVNRYNRPQQRIQAPQTDYSKMSYAEIAASIARGE